MPGIMSPDAAQLIRPAVGWSLLLWALVLPGLAAEGAVDFGREIRPWLEAYCLDCHSGERRKGDLDLDQFTSLDEFARQPRVWRGVIEQVSAGEMPPKGKPQPTTEERARLLERVNAALDQVARARAGDPGPVVLRRLSNAEYTYTLRDLTGLETLDPAREFPADSAAGEGFMNVGNALVMSPSLLTKYLEAAKEIARHAVLLPDGLRFSPSTSARDWTEETLAAIRGFYARFTEQGSGTAVNLQGIQFDTNEGGVIPLEGCLAALLLHREPLGAGRMSPGEVAASHGLNAKYLTTLWETLDGREPSLVLDAIRARWQIAGPGDASGVAAAIREWQGALWRFTTVGHIGKRDGPPAWQVPVTPLADRQEHRVALPAPNPDGAVMLYLAVSDAGDGTENDVAVWEKPRLVAPGRPDLLLRDVRRIAAEITARRCEMFAATAKCLAAAAELEDAGGPVSMEREADAQGIHPAMLAAWLECLGVGAAEAPIESLITGRLEKTADYDFIQGWTGADALSVVANSSDQHVRIPGNMKPHGLAVHPAPNRRVAVGWRSPVRGDLRVEGVVHHAHPECGNGVTWAVELRRGHTRRRLAAGVAQGSAEVQFGPFEGLRIGLGDLLSVVIGPRNGNHSCDLTAVDLRISDGERRWDLAADASPDILAGNPHADLQGNSAVWHFYSEPDQGGGPDSVLPEGSLLARWQSVQDHAERQRLAEDLEAFLLRGPVGLAEDDPNAVLWRQLASPTGPLLGSFLGRDPGDGVRSRAEAGPEVSGGQEGGWGLDDALFGGASDGEGGEADSLVVQAPSVIEIRLPAELVDGCEFVTTAALAAPSGSEGSVQMRVLSERPSGSPSVAVGAAREAGVRGTWSDGERPVTSDSPILVPSGSRARARIEQAFDDFRQVFPAALCYTKIVPVDEVVTLTLFYREDDPLRRLMLDEVEARALDRLWDALRFVSQEPLKLVDAYEQLWQFATQDADPSAFTPMGEPIRQRAAAFRQSLVEAEPAHLEAVVEFAERAYRRPLTSGDQAELRHLYTQLREQEIAHAEAVRLTLARVLVAPAFLYRLEEPAPGQTPGPVNDWELATRLSYFLWSSAPDAALREQAARGALRDPSVLASEARRMLRDPRVRRLAKEFACAWLHIYDFDSLDEKSERHFPTFTGLRGPMYEEAIRFFADAFENDASVLSFFDADHTFVNGVLAAHYGLSGVMGDDWQRVDGVRARGRGGVLGLGATLAKQSGASRTSPILRGNWVAEVLLGDRLPPPPKDVPRLPEDEASEDLTVRELTTRHSSDPRCAGCHLRIDSFGFTLEGYDAIGRRRTHDLGGRPVDTRAKLLDGTVIDGAEGLREYLLTTKREAVLQQFCRKLLGYALGRGVLLSDKPLLEAMQRELRDDDHRFGTAVGTIVRSRQFREIRGWDQQVED